MLIYWIVSDKVDRLLDGLGLDRESCFSSLHQEQLANHILEEILDHWYSGLSGNEPVWRHSPNPCSHKQRCFMCMNQSFSKRYLEEDFRVMRTGTFNFTGYCRHILKMIVLILFSP